MSNDEIKIYRISGKFVKYHQYFSFTKYVRALTEENALEKVLCDVTAQKVLRRKIDITEITPISLDDCPDQFIHQMSNI